MGQLDFDKTLDVSAVNWEIALLQYKRVIQSGSESMRVKATIKLAQLCDDIPESVSCVVVPILVEIVNNNDPSGSSNSVNSNNVVVAAMYCLKCIACLGNEKLVLGIGQSGVIPIILRLLGDAVDGFRLILVKCLWGLVNFGKENRVITVRSGGVSVVTGMLDSVQDGVRRYLLEILSALALLKEARRALRSLRKLEYLVESARYGGMISRERACQAIGLLGVMRRVRRMFVEMGVIPVLVELLRIGDERMKLVAGNSLGVISAHVSYIRPVAEAGAIPLYAELLEGADPIGKEIAEDAFCILAVAESNAVLIADHLVRILREGDDEAKAATIDVIWDLAGYKHSVSVVRNSGAIPILVHFLRDDSSEVREKVSGAIAQLSYNSADRMALISAGTIPLLIELLHDESEELRDNAVEVLMNFSDDPEQHSQIVEAVGTSSFQNMQSRLLRLRASDELMARSLRGMSIEQLTADPDLA